MTSQTEDDVAAISKVKAKFVTWVATHAAYDEPLIVAMALFDLSQKVLIQALGDRAAAYEMMRRSLADPNPSESAAGKPRSRSKP